MLDTKVENRSDLGFDPEALRQKYREERDKRLRPGARSKYIGLEGDFAAFGDDPYADPNFTRAPVEEEVDVLVLGGGITGLMTAAHLREAGVNSLRMIDKAGDFGGTWYWNRYPGVRCDVESYIYMPFLEEVGFMPTEKYSRGSEILAHCQAIGRHFRLYETALFQTEVSSTVWDEAQSRWIVRTDRNDVIKARFVAIGTGPISKPKLPGIPGIRDFKGHQFHTARWDYRYTGGTSDGGLTGLADKRVAVIGTGATGIQVIPIVGACAKETLVIQRTPSNVDLRGNRPTDMEWARSLEPGWQKRRMENFSAILTGMKVEEDLVADRWTDIWSRLGKWAGGAEAEARDTGELLQLADFEKMEEIRAHIDEVVKDPATAAALKPWYNLFCKRPIYSDEYYETFNLPSVKLIDTGGTGVEKILEHSIVVNGVAYDVDCIIYASGYDIATPTYKAGNYTLIGRGGVSLEDRWSRGVSTLHGMYTNAFPNMFIVGGITQAAASINFPHILGMQAAHAAALIKTCLDRNIRSFEVRPEAVAEWEKLLDATRVDRRQFEQDCTPGYLNNEGDPNAGLSLFSGTFSAGVFEYEKICDAWRSSCFETDVVTEQHG